MLSIAFFATLNVAMLKVIMLSVVAPTGANGSWIRTWDHVLSANALPPMAKVSFLLIK
jgi:hypothetical protein